MTSFDDRLSRRNLSPLWSQMAQLLTPEPKSPAVPHLWCYKDIRPLLMEAGDRITAEEAVRRVLVLENPGLSRTARITTSLYAGLQLVLPGEIAPNHRHSQTALRFILDGDGAQTTVDGACTIMKRGDFVLTPSMCWHEHGNESNEPMVWLDGLDIPMVQFFDASFVEDGPSPVNVRPDVSGTVVASGLLPMAGPTDRVINYSYKTARAALMALAADSAPDPWLGTKMHYADPRSGGHALPTMAAFLQFLNKGQVTKPYRSTDATIFACVEGGGKTRVDGTELSWEANDIFVIPSWYAFSLEPDTDTVLFSYSDRAAQEKLGLWREEKMTI